MEHLILDYKQKNEALRNDAVGKIQSVENQRLKEFFFILTRKLPAYEICLKEINRRFAYYDESEKP